MSGDLSKIEGLIRCENANMKEVTAITDRMSKPSYAHDEIYGQNIHIQGHIRCDPVALFEYMKDSRSLNEWTYSVRKIEPIDDTGLFRGVDAIGGGDATRIYIRTEANREALTVDYYCAWDQPKELWMIYYMRILHADRTLNKPGSIILWDNCRHPYYARNPYPETSPPNRPWVGDLWGYFYAGHTIELQNLKRIAEHRFPL